MKDKIMVFFLAISCLTAIQDSLAQAQQSVNTLDFAAKKNTIALGAAREKSQVHLKEISLPLWRSDHGGFQNILPHSQETMPTPNKASLYLAHEIANTGLSDHFSSSQNLGIFPSEPYHVHPSAIITNTPVMNFSERKALYLTSRIGMRLLGRRTGTYATGSSTEIPPASLSHPIEPRHIGGSPR